MPKPELLFIRGDTEGAFGAIKFYWPFFYVARLAENPGYEPRTLLTPTAEEAVDALADADAAIFYGHGNSGKVWLKPNRKEVLDVEGIWKLVRLRQMRNRGLMNFVHVACCETCKSPEWVQAWLEATRSLRGYEVDTYDPKNPFSVPECKLYTKASQAGP